MTPPPTHSISVSALLREAVAHLRLLDSWGWGENAPDDAIRDWIAAREWLVIHQDALDAHSKETDDG